MARTYTGRLWSWSKQIDQPAQVVTHSLLLSFAFINPAVLLAYGGLYAGAAIADGISAAAAAKQATARRRREEQERERRQREQAQRAKEADERRRAEAEVARRKASPEYRASEARCVYEARLREIERSPLDETESCAAREHAKQQLLRVLNEVMS